MAGFILAVIVGVFVGIASGLLGIGGGTLMVPVFRLGFGMSALASTATSLFTIIPTSITGCITHLRQKTSIPKLGLLCGVAGACTSPLGVWLASRSPAWLVMLAAAAIIAYSAYNMFDKARRLPKTSWKNSRWSKSYDEANRTDETQSSVKAGEVNAYCESAFVFTRKKVFIAIGIGLFAGLCSGYVGVGGGFIMVPMFVLLLGVMMRQASGTSLIAVMILAIPGSLEQGFLGNIDYLCGIAMALGSIPGAVLGASLIKKVPERELRFIFGGFLLLSAFVLAAEEALALLA